MQSKVFVKLTHVLGLLATVGGLTYFLHALITHAGELGEEDWRPSIIAGAVAVGTVCAATHILIAFVWSTMLESLGQKIGFTRSFAIVSISQIGKYLPGNIAQHLGRIALATREGIPPMFVIITTIWETVGVLLVGSILAMGAWFWTGSVFGDPNGVVAEDRILFVLAGGIGIFLLLVMGMRLGSYQYFPPVSRRGFRKALLACCAGYCGVFVTYGIGLDIFAMLLGATSSPLAAVGVFSIAWVSGFVTPGAPAGLGVREAIMMIGLAPMYGDDRAITVTVLMRLSSVVADGVALGAGLLVKRRQSKQALEVRYGED